MLNENPVFDPTVFENLKVGIENHMYDLDKLSSDIRITARVDRLDLATLSREFALFFESNLCRGITAEIRLEAALVDLASEILAIPDANPGCSLILRFHTKLSDPTQLCQRIEAVLQEIWQSQQQILQTISFVFGQEPAVYSNTIELNFSRKINENQMGDIPELAKHILQTMKELGKL